jgi:hypothetical protein
LLCCSKSLSLLHCYNRKCTKYKSFIYNLFPSFWVQ